MNLPPFRFKKMLRFNRIFILMGLLLLALPAFPQTKKDLEKKKEQLRKDIEYTNQLLNLAKKNKSTSLNQLITLNKKISYRNELINTINDEIGRVDNSIGGINQHIDSLESRMTQLKKQYARMLYFAYKNQTSYSRLSFIFSAKDFNQAYKRLKYLQQLSAYRLRQRDLIRQTQDSLSARKRELQGVRLDKTHLLTSQEKEKKNLDQEKKEQVTVLNNITSREKKLRAELQEKQKQEEKLNHAIEEIIRKQIEAAKLAARKKTASKLTANASKKTEPITSASALTATPEALKLSNDFESNKGKLPWPVDQGFISSSFGRHAHQVWKDVVVNNNGVDINSQKGAQARAIFDGKVLRVIMVVDKYAVLVQHGEYFSLYSNLKEVTVKAGDKVTTKQSIGQIQTDEEGKTEVHLEIWKGGNKMDPENWIMAKR
jgi:septal ring factor EnvC (AmiA/AmiB activator)